jgi:hypothetical protein
VSEIKKEEEQKERAPALVGISHSCDLHNHNRLFSAAGQSNIVCEEM